MTPSSASLPVTASPTTPPTGSVCPYLLAADGRWRSSAPAREHRCTAVAPATVVALEKQRRLCLAATHGGCATFIAAAGDGLDEGPIAHPPSSRRSSGRPVPRTAPLVLDHGRRAMPRGGLPADRSLAQGALLVLMVVAFAAIVVARMSGPAPDGDVLAGAGGPASEPARTAAPTGVDAATATADTSPTLPPSAEPQPTTSATAAPTATPPPGPVVYTVRSGDTLSGIAAAYGTTVAALAELNGIDDPSRLRIGQELEIPPGE